MATNEYCSACHNFVPVDYPGMDNTRCFGCQPAAGIVASTLCGTYRYPGTDSTAEGVLDVHFNPVRKVYTTTLASADGIEQESNVDAWGVSGLIGLMHATKN